MLKKHRSHNVEIEFVNDTEFSPAVYSKAHIRVALAGVLLLLVCACCAFALLALQRFVL